MNRLLALLTVVLIAGTALADIPPPKGFKRITVDHKITTDKDYADYAFFTVIGRDRVSAVKLDSKTPLEILAKDRGQRFLGCTLVAVPKDAAKKYDGEKEFFAALAAGKVEGQVKAKEQFYIQREVKDSEPRNTIVTEYKVTKINAKDGIVLADKKDEPKGEPKKDGKDSPDEENVDTPGIKCGNDGPTSSFDFLTSEPVCFNCTPRNGPTIAGAAGFAALTLGGLWLAARVRRKV